MPIDFRTTRLAALFTLMLCFTWSSCIAGGLPPAIQADSTHSQAAQANGTQSHTVLISGFKFQPDVLTVHVGDTVEWKNADIVPHNVTAADHSFNSGGIASGASWKLVVKKAGTFPYVCTPHPNMHGKLVVQ